MILHLILSLILSIETIIIIDFAMVLKGIHFKLSYMVYHCYHNSYY